MTIAPGTTSASGCRAPTRTSATFLSAAGISWGWFQGGFTPSTPVLAGASGTAAVRRPAPPQPTASTALRKPLTAHTTIRFSTMPALQTRITCRHRPQRSRPQRPGEPSLRSELFPPGRAGGDLPAVSYLKANRAQDGHPGNSSPLDEQEFLVSTINLPAVSCRSGSDGNDHHLRRLRRLVRSCDRADRQPVDFPADALTGVGACGTGTSSLAGSRRVAATGHACRSS